jgi:hypothetical protein
MQSVDLWGQTITTPDDDAAERYRSLVDAFLTMSPSTASVMNEAVAGEAAPLAHITFGYLMMMAHTAHGRSAALGVVHDLVSSRTTLNPREQQHLEALSAWTTGSIRRYCDTLGSILQSWPLDMVAARLEHFERFSLHDLDAMAASADRLRNLWPHDAPYRSYLDGMAAFSHEELGHYGIAEELGREAVETAPEDLWSIHAVAHVLEMQGRADDGVEWLTSHESTLVTGGSFAGHLWWHLGLYHLAHGHHDEVLRLLDQRVRPDDATDGLTLTNMISMLARLDFLGVDVGERWDRLIEGSALRIGHHCRPFNDCHFAYALARTGSHDQLVALLDGMATWAERTDDVATVLTEVGLVTALGMAALGSGDRASAAAHLESAAPSLHLLGGSFAQRDLFVRARAHAM